jgi:hypothetical protein
MPPVGANDLCQQDEVEQGVVWTDAPLHATSAACCDAAPSWPSQLRGSQRSGPVVVCSHLSGKASHHRPTAVFVDSHTSTTPVTARLLGVRADVDVALALIRP